jgi:cytochrome P450
MASLVRRARTQPGDDILGMLVRQHGAELTDDELIGIASLLLLAGHETTSNMLGLGTLALVRHPDQLGVVRDDPDAVGPAIEEMLRWLSIVHSAIPRITTTDVEVAGVPIPAGRLVFVSLPAGNRDPDFIDLPEALDVRRGAPGHLAFGHGVHHCLGAPLARMEMRIAFPALLRRFPALALAEDFDDVQFRSFHFIYGLKSLEVGW